MMWKLIFLGLIIGLVIYMIKRGLSQTGRRSDADPTNQENTTHQAKKKPTEKAEDMVQCTLCAVHLPRSEAYMADGHLYCSQEHLPKQ